MILVRSKGCKTCRERKVKCDEGRPTCARCQRARIICGGYARPLKWVDETANLAHRPHGAGRAKAGEVVREMAAQRPAAAKAVAAVTAVAATDPDAPSPVIRPRLAKYMALIPRPVSEFSAVNDMYVAFLRRKWFISEKYNNFQSWASRVLVGDPEDVSFVALHCLAAAYFARMHGKPAQVVTQGTALYGKALIKLRDRIQDPRTAFDASNVAAATALHLYEMVTCANETAWLQHAGGVGRLIEMRGPASFQRSPDHEHFLTARLEIVFEAGVRRRPCFLAQAEWMTLPWARRPEPRSMLTKLVDLYVVSPGYYAEQGDIARDAAAGHDVSARRAALIERMAASLRDLIRWRREWAKLHPAPAREVPVDSRVSLTLDASGKALYPTVLDFVDSHVAREVLLYNALLMTLQGMGGSLYGVRILDVAFDGLDDEPSPAVAEADRAGPLVLPTRDQSFLTPCREICRSVDYHLLRDELTPGALSLLMPLRICFLGLCMHSRTEEVRYVIRVFRILADHTGIELPRHLSSLHQLGTNKPIEGNFTERLTPAIVDVASPGGASP